MNTVKPINDFAGAQAYLRQFYASSSGPYSLDSMRALMEHLGNPQDRPRIVHVAGTSGKTSTAYYLSALLTVSGRHTGLTVSPHVDELNERLQIDGRPLPEKVFCAALEEFARAIEGAPVQPSWFECLVAFAYWYFDRQKVDYAIVETGLGGLLDGTNVVSRPDKVCVITDIGYDHMDVLGDTLAAIAEQKLGIVGPGNPLFIQAQSQEIMAVARHTAASTGSELQIVSQTADQTGLPSYQARNWQLALTVYKFLQARDGLPELSTAQLAQAQHTQVPGRMDVIKHRGKTVVLDGAHNAQKMQAFISSFQKLYPGERPAVLIGMKAGKEYAGIVPLLAKVTDRVICTAFKADQDLPIKSMNPEELAEAFTVAGVEQIGIASQHHEALESALNGPEKIIIITGSIYLLGQLRPLLT